MERKRRVEREIVKEGLRVWLERKAREITRKRDNVVVGVLVWRFSKKLKLGDNKGHARERPDRLEKGRVSGLKRYWEGLGTPSVATDLT